MKQYLITGATGFIGLELCKNLRKKNIEIYILTRKNNIFLKKLGVKFINENWQDFKKFNKKIIFDVVIHCAGNPTFGNGQNYFKDNFLSTVNFFNCIKKYTKSKFIFVSSIGSVDRKWNDRCEKKLDEETSESPSSDYGKSKLLVEKFLKNQTLDTAIIRPSLVVGNGMRNNSHFNYFIQSILNKSIFSYFKWTGSMSVIDVRDLAEAIYLISVKKLSTNHEIFFCAGESVKIYDLIKFIDPNSGNLIIPQILKLINNYINFLPFKIKALIYPALVANDNKLKKIGWKKKYCVWETLNFLVKREKFLKDINNKPPAGYTLITGGLSGLGYELVKKLSYKRDKIIVVDKNIRSLSKKINKRLLKKIKFFKVDLSNTNEVEYFIKNQLIKYPIVEFFSNAGIAKRGNFVSEKFSTHQDIFHVNLLSILQLYHKIYQDMISLNFGRFVIINSSASFQPLPNLASYSASKIALDYCTQCLQIENKFKNIRILSVFPSGMKTNFQKKAGVKVLKNEKLLSTSYVFDCIARGISKKNTKIIIGFRAKIMHVLNKFIPENMKIKIYDNLMSKYR